MSVILNIATSVPPYKYRQEDLADYMADHLRLDAQDRRKMKLMYAKSGIQNRYSVLPDFNSDHPQAGMFEPSNTANGVPTVEQRMSHYQKSALELSLDAIQKALGTVYKKEQITHLITVSCTGMSAPGLDIEITQELGLNENINRTSINFMGCYAAIHGLKQADYICKSDPNAIVMLVCVEICTLHFQKINDDDNNMANMIFADGAAATLIVSDLHAQTNELHGQYIKSFHSKIVLTGKKDMAWQITASGFLMTLSSYIPNLLKEGFHDFFSEGLRKANLEKKDIVRWAIHPGGRKIIEVIQTELQLLDKDIESSLRILKNFGNMSAPTIMFVLKDLWLHDNGKIINDKTYVAAFGPGLTMESLILENV
jgi:predicted naringenin-chalcone synthase